MWPIGREKILIYLIVTLSVFLIFLLGIYFYAKNKLEEKSQLPARYQQAQIPLTPTIKSNY